jgi:hypothetical protein
MVYFDSSPNFDKSMALVSVLPKMTYDLPALVLPLGSTLTGNGGMDVLNAGTGDDTIIINASNIAALEKTGAGNRARVDGGGGIDTLKLEG